MMMEFNTVTVYGGMHKGSLCDLTHCYYLAFIYPHVSC